MADDPQEQSVYSENDTLDINELATLNEDISLEFIERLQSQVARDANAFNSGQANEELFEDIEPPVEKNTEENYNTQENSDSDAEADFEKRYKAKKLNSDFEIAKPQEAETPNEIKEDTVAEEKKETSSDDIIEKSQTDKNNEQQDKIENVSGGNIIERPISKKQEEYNAGLDLLDDNTKYSKYVVYINPENREFIDSLTVKERKNLINNIIHEQDNIVVTKHKLNNLQTIIRHVIVAIITITVAIPITYFIINMSLEASIDNYRRSQGMFQTLYREHGKITNSRELK